MLKTKCNNCDKWVCSPLLIEVKETDCPKCGTCIPINELYVSTGPFSFYRDSLVQNVPIYMKILKEKVLQAFHLKM